MTKLPKALAAVADKVDATFAAHGVKLTLGGEPTYIPTDPVGPEWSVTALGPTKLRYAYTLTDALIAQSLPNAVAVYSPGKFYPGETNPRWAINLVWNRDGTPLVPSLGLVVRKPALLDQATLDTFRQGLSKRLAVGDRWVRGVDPFEPTRPVAILPLDYKEGAGFVVEDWRCGDSMDLLHTDGPAGLRLPLNKLPEDVNRRAFVVEILEGKLHLFLPPLLQAPFLALLEAVAATLRDLSLGDAILSGYVPSDETKSWTRMAVASDPGVLEVNLPPCMNWREYATWLDVLEKACGTAGLRSFKQLTAEDQIGSGGGNHLLFGGPTLDENPLFTHPAWVTSMLRYWQHHPSLAYLFTGQYVGSSSQAPRPDECATSLYDLEMAYRFLEELPEGDHRYLLSETLRHLHTDTSGNTHRSETSFDKFWNVNFDGGCRGLVEFRAVETLPHARWMSAIALLWHSLAAYLLQHPFKEPLIDLGDKLHDAYFLPGFLWADFERILRDLRRAGFKLPAALFREIFDWRFPVMLHHEAEGDATADLTIRRAHEGWPLLCETPLEGGSTSRFVDTSIERLEFVVSREFAEQYTVRVQGRELPLQRFPSGHLGAGLRYRRTALYPSLHPGILPQMPLVLTLEKKGEAPIVYHLEQDRRLFTKQPTPPEPIATSDQPCKRLHNRLVTFDLRLP